MTLFQTIKSAISSLLHHKVRSMFTIVGVVIGIATVTIVLSTGEGVKQFIVGQIQSYGSDVLFVEARPPEEIVFTLITTMTAKQAYEIRDSEEFPYVKDVYAFVGTQAIASSRYEQITTDVFGTNEAFVRIDQAEIARGRFFTLLEEKSLKRVAVLGSEAAEKLFPAGDPLGQTIKLNKLNFKIIGLMEERGADMGMNFDKMVFVPLDVAQKQMAGTDYILYFAVQVTDSAHIDYTKEQVRQYLRFKHGIKGEGKDDFAITSSEEAIEMVDGVLLGIKFLLLGVGFISLLVGGVGIMNIMYVTVTERIKEIGVRKAVGARSRDILYQFLFEAIIMTGIGGVIGIIVGVTITYLIIGLAEYYGFFWPYHLSWDAVIWALVVALIFGLVFGLAPARKAAGQRPIEALRYE